MSPDGLASDLAFAVECVNRCANLSDVNGVMPSPTRRSAMRETARRLKAYADTLTSIASRPSGAFPR